MSRNGSQTKGAVGPATDAQDDFLRRKRFHSLTKWPGGKRAPETDAFSTLPRSMKAGHRYSRFMPTVSRKHTPRTLKIPVEDPEEEWVDEVVEEQPGQTHVIVSMAPSAETQTEVEVIPPPPPPPPPVVIKEPVTSAESERARRRDMKRLMRTLEPLSGTVQQQAFTLEETQKSLRRLNLTQRELLQHVEESKAPGDEQAQLLMSMNDVHHQLQRLQSQQAARTEQESQLEDRIGEVREMIASSTVPLENFVQFSADIQKQIVKVSDALHHLKRRQEVLSETVDKSRRDQKRLLKQEKSLSHVATMLEDIHGYTMEKKAEDELDSKKQGTVELNLTRGKQFLESNSLPTDSPVIIEVIAKLIAYIESDADEEVQETLYDFREEASRSWESKDMEKKALQGLYKLSLFTKSHKSSLLLADVSEGSDSKSQPNEETAKKSAAEFVRGAINFKSEATGKMLLERMDPKQRKEVVNTIVKGEDGMEDSYLVFVCTRSEDLDMFKYIIDCGADLNVTDGSENQSILHVLCRLSADPNKEELTLNMMDIIYKHAGDWWIQRDDIEISPTNHADDAKLAALRCIFSMRDSKGLNAIQLAAKEASPQMIKKIMTNPPYFPEANPADYNCDGAIRVYITDDLDPRFTGRDASVLESIVNRENDAYEIVKMEPFCEIFEDKWDRYKVFYWIWFVLYMLYICTYSACAVGRHVHATSLAESYSSDGDQFRAGAEIACVLFLPLFYYGEVCDYTKTTCNWKWLFSDFIRLANLTFTISVLFTIIFRLTMNPIEDIFLCFSLIIGWLMTIRFLVATPQMGVFPSVIFKVFQEDILKRYIWIFLIILAGTTTAIFCAYQRETVSDFPRDSFVKSILSVFLLTFGLLETDFITQGYWPGVGVTLFIFYLWLGNILLVNMLIAMVNDTYSMTRQEKQLAWMHTKAYYSLVMERRLPKAIWIPYCNDRYDKQPSKLWSLAHRIRLYTTTKLRYGHKPRRKTYFEEPVQIEHFVIVK